MTHPVTVNSIYPEFKASCKKQVLRFLSEKAAANLNIDRDEIFALLMKYEQEMPSGIGDGVAIPHLRIPGASVPFSLFARLSEAIEFDAVDNRPVDLVFFLISPEEDGPHHLRRLSRVTRLFRDSALCRRLRNANNDNAIRTLITEPGAALHAAA